MVVQPSANDMAAQESDATTMTRLRVGGLSAQPNISENRADAGNQRVNKVRGTTNILDQSQPLCKHIIHPLEIQM